MVDLCFDDVDGLNTKNIMNMIGNMKFGSVVHKLWSKNMGINGGGTKKYE